MQPKVAEYVIGRLADLGISHVFGIPGDFSFSIDDAIEDHPDLSFVVSSNELNAAYSADGYARIHGAAILTTTYGVGELSALNGIMGAKAEHSVIFHLVGAPSTRATRAGHVLHHSLGDGVTGNFFDLSAATACVAASITPANCVSEMERVITTAFTNRQPAYIQIPCDIGHMEIIGTGIKGVPISQLPRPTSVTSELDAAMTAIARRFKAATRPVIIASYKLGRYGVVDRLMKLVESSGIPYVTTPIDKAVAPETHDKFLGWYRGANSEKSVIDAVENADLILDLGGCTFDDLSTGFCTARASRNSIVTVAPYIVTMMTQADGVYPIERSYSSVWIGDVLDAMIAMGPLPSANCAIRGALVTALPPRYDGPGISYYNVQQAVESILTGDNILVVETGTASFRFATLQIPEGCSWQTQTLWGSIGWATPAAFGAAMAAQDKRVILVTGDGSHQLTATEVGVMGRYGAKPIIIVLNNGVYGVEEYLELNKQCSYNDLALWEYAKIPEAMGCGASWLSLKVTSVDELNETVKIARDHDGGVYIEVILGQKLFPAMDQKKLEHAYLVPPLQEDTQL